MTTVTAIAALLISIASFSFTIYQYRILHQIRAGEKASTLLRFAHDLRRKSEDLKYKVESTDGVPDFSGFLIKVNTLVEQGIGSLALSRKLSWDELQKLEQKLFLLELEIDLLYKQIVEVDRFNKEVRA